MPLRLTPERRRGVEILDDRTTPDGLRARSMADIERSNRLFGGRRSAIDALRVVIPQLPSQATLLDVGTGLSDIPRDAARVAARAGVRLDVLGLDISESLARTARRRLAAALVGDALRLPLADDSVDVVTCSQMLHHFIEPDARQVIAELHRVARRWVIVSDLERSWLAAGGFWLASVALGFHAITRNDGMVSVLRGFTTPELRQLVSDVTGHAPLVRRGIFWRLSAVWDKTSAVVRDS